MLLLGRAVGLSARGAFLAALTRALQTQAAQRGRGLRLMTESITSPTVAASRLSMPPRARNCLGRARRLAGHSRVPLPPARITAQRIGGIVGDLPENGKGARWRPSLTHDAN
jgi:hypothetical protein